MIPETAEDVTRQWIEESIGDGSALKAFDIQMLSEGRGFAGMTYKLGLNWEGSNAPSSVVMKLHSTDPAKARMIMHGYKGEKKFYEDFADHTPLHTPALHFAEVDEELARYVLILEDLDYIEFGDQIAGGSDEQVIEAVKGLARHHAAFWEDKRIGAIPVPDEPVEPKVLHPLLLELIEDVRGTFGRGLPLVLSCASLIIESIGAPDFEPPKTRIIRQYTLVHTDYRLDNMGFDADGRLTVIDWGCTPGACHNDLAYFLSCSMTADQITRLWDDLVTTYYDELTGAGVSNYEMINLQAGLREALIGQCMIILLALGIFSRYNRDGHTGDISVIPEGIQGLINNLIHDPRGFELLMAMSERTEAALKMIIPGGNVAGPMLLGAMRQVTAFKSWWATLQV